MRLTAMYRRSRRRLRVRDPGLTRAAMGLKTVLAVVLALAAFHGAGSPVNLVAAMAAGFLMQVPAGGRRRDELALMVTVGLVMSALVVLGAAVSAAPAPAAVLVVGVAFSTFYARGRFPSVSGSALFVFILFLIATAFPGGSVRAGQEGLAVLAGLASALVIYFAVLPRRPGRALADVLAGLAGTTAVLLGALSARLRTEGAPPGRLERELGWLEEAAAKSRAIGDILPDRDEGEPAARAAFEVLHDLVVLRRCVEAMRTDGEQASALADLLDTLAAEFVGLEAGNPERPDLEPALDAFERRVLAMLAPEDLGAMAQPAIAAAVARRLAAAAAELAAALPRLRQGLR